jgi:flagellar motor switch protein FliG
MSLELRGMTGIQRAAVLLLALGETYGKEVWGMLDEEEIRLLTAEMTQLGTIESQVVESLFEDFATKARAVSLRGDFEGTERLLNKILPKSTVDVIMEEMRGPAGRNMWQKLTNVQPQLLANYLKNEYPQTIAVILSKLRADHTARVLSELPPSLAEEVVNRMLTMGPVPRDVLQEIDGALRREFIASLTRAARRDPHEQMADIMNQLGRNEEGRFLNAITRENPDGADKIKALMFTFEDLANLDRAGIQTLLRSLDKSILAQALKGASEALRNLFLSNMTQRAGKMLRDEMDNLGPMRLKDVDEAQQSVVRSVKQLEADGLLQLDRSGESEEMVF